MRIHRSGKSALARFLALLLCLGLPSPSFALRNESALEAGLEEELQRALADQNDPFMATAQTLADRLTRAFQPAAGLEEVPVKAVRLALMMKIPQQFLNQIRDSEIRALYGGRTIGAGDVLREIALFGRMPRYLAKPPAQAVADVVNEARARYERRLSDLAGHIERIQTLLRTEKAGDAANADVEIWEIGVMILATAITREEADFLRDLNGLFGAVQGRLNSEPPLPAELETSLRKWQYRALAVLSASGELSEENAVSFLQDPASGRFSAWVTLATIFSELIPDAEPTGVPLQRWITAYSAASHCLRLEDLAPWERDALPADYPVSPQGIFVDDSVVEFLRDRIGPHYSKPAIVEQMRVVLERYGRPPVELMRDLLLRRPAAVWNAAALQEEVVSALYDRLGEPTPAIAAAWLAYGALNRSRRLDDSYPLWWMKIPVPPFTGEMGWPGRQLPSRPFDLLYVAELVYEQLEEKDLRGALEDPVLADEMRASGVTPEDFLYLVFGRRQGVSGSASQFQSDALALERLAFLRPILFALISTWKTLGPERKPTPMSVLLAFHHRPQAELSLPQRDQEALVERVLEVLGMPGGQSKPNPAAGLEEGESPEGAFLQRLIPAGMARDPLVITAGLEERFPGLARLASVPGVELQGDRDAGAVIADLLIRYPEEFYGLRVAGLEGEMPAFRLAAGVAQVGLEEIPTGAAGFRKVVLDILSALSGLKEEAIAVREGFEAFMAGLEASAASA